MFGHMKLQKCPGDGVDHGGVLPMKREELMQMLVDKFVEETVGGWFLWFPATTTDQGSACLEVEQVVQGSRRVNVFSYNINPTTERSLN